MNNLRMVDVDELRRNPEDGAYHCPKCDAPFTRRSNLRRHYGIRTHHLHIVEKFMPNVSSSSIRYPQ